MPGISKLSYTRQFPRYQFSPVASNAFISTSNKKFGNSSLFMDGASDDIRIYDTGTALGSGEFTIECWIWLPNLSSTHGICDFRTSGANQIAPAININTSGQILYNMNGVTRITASGVPTRTWWHFACSRSAGNLRIFINGTQSGGTFSDSSNYTFSQLIIGSLTGGNNNPLDGFIDEFRISRVGRYNTTFTPQTEPYTNDENTLLLLHFNDYNGSTTIVDDIGDPIVEETRPALTATRVGNTIISTSQSKFGSSSAYFDGVGDLLRFTDKSLWIMFNDFTFEGWIYLTSLSEAKHIFDYRNVTTSQVAPLLRVLTTGALDYYVSGASRIAGTAGQISLNTWYHVAVCRNDTSTRMFLDGVQVGSTYTDSNIYVQNALCIGAYTGGANSVAGYIDEVRISNTARYTTTFTPSTEPFTPNNNTVLLLHFEGSNNDTTFTDSVS